MSVKRVSLFDNTSGWKPSYLVFDNGLHVICAVPYYYDYDAYLFGQAVITGPVHMICGIACKPTDDMEFYEYEWESLNDNMETHCAYTNVGNLVSIDELDKDKDSDVITDWLEMVGMERRKIDGLVRGLDRILEQEWDKSVPMVEKVPLQ